VRKSRRFARRRGEIFALEHRMACQKTGFWWMVLMQGSVYFSVVHGAV
jgi:hypothetical protein